MSSDTVWKVVKRDSGACVTPLRFHSEVEAYNWVERNQPLFKEEITERLFFLEHEPMFTQDTHDTFMKAVTGENALTK
jgi:hypothetical protein